MAYKPVMLVILDGWGISHERENNAIALAEKNFYDSLLIKYPHTVLETSGEVVGLPEGQIDRKSVV